MTKIWEKVITDALTDEMIKIAKKAIKEGATIEFISKITDLDIETIKTLQEQETDENGG